MSLPLAGVSVVVTRSQHQSAQLVSALRAVGATTIELPVIEMVQVDSASLQGALSQLGSYDWLVVTSPNTVGFIGDSIASFGGKVAAIGTGTAEVLVAAGLHVDLVPEKFVAESLVEAFPTGPGRVFLPSAEVAREVIPDGLRAKGWDVEVVTTYRTVAAAPSAESIELAKGADAVTFTSSSTVTAFVKLIPKSPKFVACIGPITARTAEENGLRVDLIADEHTVPGLVNALVARLG